MAKLTFLGTGSAFNFADGNTSAFLRAGDRGILIDCGSTVPHALDARGLLNDVTDVVISHTHSDHVGGLELLAQWYYWVRGHHKAPPPRLHVPEDIYRKLQHVVALGLDCVQNDYGRPLRASLESYFDVRIVRSMESFSLGHASCVYLPVRHVPTPDPRDFPSYGFAFEVRNWSEAMRFGFSADTREVFDSTGVAIQFEGYKKKDVKALFHDCQLFTGPNNGAGDVHISLERLNAEMDAEDKAITWLMHYGKNWREVMLTGAATGFKGFVDRWQTFELLEE